MACPSDFSVGCVHVTVLSPVSHTRSHHVITVEHDTTTGYKQYRVRLGPGLIPTCKCKVGTIRFISCFYHSPGYYPSSCLRYTPKFSQENPFQSHAKNQKHKLSTTNSDVTGIRVTYPGHGYTRLHRYTRRLGYPGTPAYITTDTPLVYTGEKAGLYHTFGMMAPPLGRISVPIFSTKHWGGKQTDTTKIVVFERFRGHELSIDASFGVEWMLLCYLYTYHTYEIYLALDV